MTLERISRETENRTQWERMNHGAIGAVRSRITEVQTKENVLC